MLDVLLAVFWTSVVFALVWTAMSGLFAVLSGWRRLARAYPGSGGPPTWAFYRVSGRVEHGAYGGCLRVHADNRGVWIGTTPMFPFHPSVLIPWRHVVLSPPRGSRGIVLGTKDPRTVRVELRNESVAQAILAACSRWAP